MSHELRTPMNAILGMIKVAIPKATDATVKDCLQTAKGSADLLLTLLNDLLDSARIESGKLELESIPFSLRQMLDQIAQMLAVRAGEKGLSFYCRMPDEMPDAIEGDQMRLQQVLLNLAGNAIKFTECGEVDIRVRAISQDGEASLEFAVRDTGIGIPTSVQERLFRPFSQADSSMSRAFRRHGPRALHMQEPGGRDGRAHLGRKRGGQGGARSTSPSGCPWQWNCLSSSRPRSLLPRSPTASYAFCWWKTIPPTRNWPRISCRIGGHVVEIAGDGQEALRLTEQNRYDVILMDVQMPGMNGLEATAAIRKREDNGNRVPIIAMTAYALRGDRERCINAGMDSYLSKPVNAQEMIGLVESLAAAAAPISTGAASTASSPA